MNNKILFVLWIVVTTILFGCLKPPEYPATPQISFNSIKVNGNNVITVRINFKDGDGDVGLNTDETDPKYRLGDSTGTTKPRIFVYNSFNKNYWVDIFIKKKGVYKLVKFTTDFPTDNFYDFDGIVPITSESSLKNKTAIEGYIDYDMDFGLVTKTSTNPPFTLSNDTIKFNIRLVDRNLNISDTTETAPIVIFKK